MTKDSLSLGFGIIGAGWVGEPHAQAIGRACERIIAAKTMLNSGELGAVYFARSALLKLWMEPHRQAWHLDPACGGGMLFTAGIHALDGLLWLVGEPASSGYAGVATRFHDMPVDDLAELIIRFRGGAIGGWRRRPQCRGLHRGGVRIVQAPLRDRARAVTPIPSSLDSVVV